MSDKQLDRDEQTGRFLAGNSGNGGRKRGSRSKLSQAFLDVLNADFDAHGADVVVKVRTEQPAVYFKTVAALLPAKLEASLTQVSVFANYDLQDPQEFLQAYRIAKSMIGAEPPTIEVESDRRDAEFADD
jgi:hypothetical protein